MSQHWGHFLLQMPGKMQHHEFMMPNHMETETPHAQNFGKLDITIRWPGCMPLRECLWGVCVCALKYAFLSGGGLVVVGGSLDGVLVMAALLGKNRRPYSQYSTYGHAEGPAEPCRSSGPMGLAKQSVKNESHTKVERTCVTCLLRTTGKADRCRGWLGSLQCLQIFPQQWPLIGANAQLLQMYDNPSTDGGGQAPMQTEPSPR